MPQVVLHRSRIRSLRPWKGIASNYDADVDGARSRHAAWSLDLPASLAFARSMKNRIAFWGEVEVRQLDEDIEASASGA